MVLPEAVEGLSRGRRFGMLTPRETEVLRLVAEGKASKEIAAELRVTLSTVSRHIANIYAKIDARNRADATRFALGAGGTEAAWLGYREARAVRHLARA